jgi:multisubunit Na+/H+ antiporter MnhB subunit
MTGVLAAGVGALVVAIAAWIVVARENFAAVIAFVAYGLLLALAWVLLSAVDVALTEAAIGGGLTGALLLGAGARLRAGNVLAAERPSAALRLGAGVLSALIAAGLAAAVLAMPEPPPTLAPAAAANAAATGLGNPVTNVLMAFRAMDTMLEKVALLLALVGVWSLAQDRFWRGRPALARSVEADTLAFLAQMLVPVGIIVGIYMLWVGADDPGGAFQGGTVLAAMWLLVMLAGRADTPLLGDRRLRLVLILGPAVFLIVGTGGLLFGDAFLSYPQAFAKPLILAIEFAMTATILATLCLLLLGPPARGSS